MCTYGRYKNQLRPISNGLRTRWVSPLFFITLSACTAKLHSPVELSTSTELPTSQGFQASPQVPIVLFNATPAISTLITGDVVTISGSNGTPPYRYFIQSGGGSIDSNTGIYTAGSGADVVLIEVKDSTGLIAYSTLQVIQPPQISPQNIELAENTSFPFSVSGTQSPFTYHVTSGPATVDGSGRFTAGALAGASPETAILRVTDQSGNSSQATIKINPALSLSPSALNVAKNSTQTFTATHGVSPYTFSVTSGNGVINSSNGVYTAASQIGVDIIQVRDSLGNGVSSAVAIQNDLVLSPLNSVVAQGSTVTFTPIGGVAPYSFTFATSPLGSIAPSSGVYSAPGSGLGNTTIQVTDSIGESALATVEVKAGLSLSVSSIVLPVNGVFTLSAVTSGGVGAISYSAAQGILSGSVYTAPGVPGTYPIQVHDSQSPLPNQASLEVIVNPALSLSPTFGSVAVTGSRSFSGAGGVPPYSYSIAGGSGSVNTTTGIYTAGNSSGLATVRVTDAYGSTAISSVSIIPALAISPAAPSIVVNSSTTFSATGGIAPYTFELVSGGGATTDPATGVYTAPSGPGVSIVRVRDSLGSHSDALVTSVAALALSPPNALVLISKKISFTPNGGKTPYSYSVISGGGIIDSSGQYTAPSTPGSAMVLVTDSLGSTATASIQISGGLAISPAFKTLAASQTMTFSASGGIPPYTYTKIGGGFIAPSTGIYTAPGTSGSASIIVIDSQGTSSTAFLTIAAPLSLTPSSKMLSIGNNSGFSAGGGVPPYTFSASNGLISTSGYYMAGGSSGVATLTATDSAGLTASSVVTITAGISLSPENLNTSFGGEATFSASGGVPPYSYVIHDSNILARKSQSITSGIYTAPTFAASELIRVADSLGNTSQSFVQVFSAPIISPSSKTIAPGNSISFKASGGKPPYTYSKLSGGGSIASATGAYTSGGSSGSDILRVTDALGQSSDAVVTVQSSLTLSPSAVTLTVATATSFSATGGVPAYVYSLLGGGALSGSTFTASNLSGPSIVRVTDSLGNFKDASIVMVAGAPQSMELVSGNSQIGSAQSTLAQGLSVLVQDVYGNRVNAAIVDWAQIQGDGSLSSASSQTDSNGNTSVDLTLGGPGAHTVVATLQGGSNPIVTFTATAVSGVATDLYFSNSPSSPEIAGVSFSPQPQVRIRDAYGNTAPTATGVITLSIFTDSTCTSSAGGGTLNAPTLSTTAGIASFTNVSYTKSGTYFLKAQSGSLTSACSSTHNASGFTVGPAVVSATDSTLVAVPTSVAANGSATSTFTATLKDQYLNLVQGKTVSLASSRGGSDSISITSETSNASGQAIFTAKSTTSGVATFTATDTTDSIAITQTAGVTFTVGATHHYSITAPTPQIAGSSFSMTVTAQDINNNTTPSYTGIINLTSTDGQAVLPTNYTFQGSDNGVKVFIGVILKTAVSRTITGMDTVTSSITGTSNTVTVTPAVVSASQSLLSHPPTVQSNATTTITLTTKDSYGNLNPTGITSVTLTSTPNPGTGNLGTQSGASGVYTRLFTGILAGPVTLDADINGSAVASSSITVTVGADASLTFSQVPTAASTGAGVAFSQQPIVRVLDSYGNLTTSTASIALFAYTDSICSTLVGSGTVNDTPRSAISGSATFSSASYTKAGSYYLGATSGALTKACAPISIIPAAASNTTSSFTANPASITANGTATSTLTATLMDVYSNTISGASVTVTSTGVTNTLLSSPSNTNGLGVATLTTSATTAGVATFTATSDSVSKTSVVTFTPGPATTLTFSTQPSVTATAGVTFSPQPVVRILDTNGNLTSNTNTITLTAFINSGCTTPGTGTFTSSPTAASAGTASFSGVNHTKSEMLFIRATSTTFTSACSNAINVAANSGVKLFFIENPGGATFTSQQNFNPAPTVGIYDTYGNLTSSTGVPITVALVTNPGPGTLTGTLGVASSSGVSSFNNLQISKAASGYTITGSSGSLTVTPTTSAFSIIAGAPSEMTLNGPTSGSSNSCIGPYSLTLKDAGGNNAFATGNWTTSIAATEPSGLASLFSNSGCTTSTAAATFTSGQSTSPNFYLNDTTSSSETVTLTANGAGNGLGIANQNVTITVNPCPTNYIYVPGNLSYQVAKAGGALTSGQGFCVMKYEAKAGTAATSTSSGTPRVSITQPAAATACANNGANYHLITNSEWMVIARNIETNPLNWNTSTLATVDSNNALGNVSGVVGTGVIPRGNSDGNPNSALAATADTNPTYGTGDTTWLQKRTHTLSNGSIIWDLAGNVGEWVANVGTPSPTLSGWNALSSLSTTNRLLLGPLNSSYSSTHNLGQIWGGTQTYVARGGIYTNAATDGGGGSYAGIYNAAMGSLSTTSSIYLGFRCAFSLP